MGAQARVSNIPMRVRLAHRLFEKPMRGRGVRKGTLRSQKGDDDDGRKPLQWKKKLSSFRVSVLHKDLKHARSLVRLNFKAWSRFKVPHVRDGWLRGSCAHQKCARVC